MKTIYKLKQIPENIISVALRDLDFSAVDAINEENNSILRDVYKRVQFGLSDYAYISSGNASGGLIHCVSRDPQYNLAVRVSVFVRYGSGRDARIYPSSHKVFSTLNEFLRYGLPSGRLIVVGGWYDELKRGAA